MKTIIFAPEKGVNKIVKSFLPVLLLLLFNTAFAQPLMEKVSTALILEIENMSGDQEILVWVYFNDKGTITQKYFDDPTLVVSEKSLKRRAKVFDRFSLISKKDFPLNPSYITQVESNGLRVKHHSKWLNAVSGYVKKSDVLNIASLKITKKIDKVYRFRKGEEPESPGNNTQLPNNNKPSDGDYSYDYGDSYDQLQQINVPAVHDLGYTGQGVMICLMDAGFNRLSHDVFLSMDIIAAWDFVNNDPNVGNEGDLGDGSHGTQTLSVIGGFAPGHLIGPAFNSSYILAKTENTESETPIEEDNWVAAMEWADSIGVDVTSTSLSYLTYDYPYPSYTWMDMDGNTAIITNAADYAAYIGIVVVNSAGNEGYNSSHNTLGAPADGDSVITAGAVDDSGIRSSFSSVGPTVDGRIKPDVMALGSWNVVASPYGDHSYTNASGTSFSCPLSAGVAALILCASPALTPMQVREAMRQTASQSNSPDNLYGWGILNALDAINYYSAFQLSIFLQDGWNMVSVPGINPNGQAPNYWWMNHIGNIYGYIPGTGYLTATTTSPTEGYWMRQSGDQTYNTGDEWPAGGILRVPHDTLFLSGWTMIGVYECPVPTGLLTTTGSVYGYSDGYEAVDTLFPGYGYWIKITDPGGLSFPPCNSVFPKQETFRSALDGFGKIIFSDHSGKVYTLYVITTGINAAQFELPPPPPAGMFDIRYGSGRIAEDLGNTMQSIEMTGITYPVKVRTEGTDIRLQDVTGKEINTILESGEEITIRSSNINKLLVTGEAVPSDYTLEQNYPNPFNPTTTIKFSLHEATEVTLTIYNMMGQEVAELVNEKLEPGRYGYEWNAKNVASGMYIYELRTDKFVSIKKMMLLK